MISLGPLSRCERLLSQVVDARTSHGAQMFSHRAIETGCDPEGAQREKDWQDAWKATFEREEKERKEREAKPRFRGR